MSLQILSDASKRQSYDMFGNDGVGSAGMGGMNSGKASEIFEQFFKSMSGEDGNGFESSGSFGGASFSFAFNKGGRKKRKGGAADLLGQQYGQAGGGGDAGAGGYGDMKDMKGLGGDAGAGGYGDMKGAGGDAGAGGYGDMKGAGGDAGAGGYGDMKGAGGDAGAGGYGDLTKDIQGAQRQGRAKANAGDAGASGYGNMKDAGGAGGYGGADGGAQGYGDAGGAGGAGAGYGGADGGQAGYGGIKEKMQQQQGKRKRGDRKALPKVPSPFLSGHVTELTAGTFRQVTKKERGATVWMIYFYNGDEKSLH